MTSKRTVHAFPVSVKGVAVQDERVLLLENERAEWELPGGKLELGEDPLACVVREISEEAGWQVTAGPSWTAGSTTSARDRMWSSLPTAATSPARLPR